MCFDDGLGWISISGILGKVATQAGCKQCGLNEKSACYANLLAASGLRCKYGNTFGIRVGANSAAQHEISMTCVPRDSSCIK